MVPEGNSTGGKPVESRLAESFRPERLQHPLITGYEKNIALSHDRRFSVDRTRRHQ
jgi:hypothetical protein